MATPFPDSARIEVSAELAHELLETAEGLPLYDNRDYYSSSLQEIVLNQVRRANPQAFDELIASIKRRLEQWPYCVLINGFRFDEGNRIFVAINRAFGELVAGPYEKPRAQLVHYIQPATDIPSARGGHESERLHTDTADWDPPVKLISMICVRADPEGGGRSRVLDVDSIRSEVQARLGMEVLQLLDTEPVPWQLAPYCGGGVKWRTVLTDSSICWRRYTIDNALNLSGLKLSDELLKSLDSFENVVSETSRTIEFLMREGELLFSNNMRTIHARTPIASGAASERLMIRSWIRTS